jgi:penicillin amidase
MLTTMLLAGSVLAGPLAAAPQPPQQALGQNHPSTQTLSVRGLRRPVKILRDHWGIAHIYAANEHDLFFAQGYNVASDRLFQLEMWRREATGTVAEILGRGELDRDIGNRLFTYRGDLTQELNWYHPHGAAIIQAFVDGINAYIERTRAEPKLLSREFQLLGIKPGLWTPAVVVSRFNGLLGNIGEEMEIALAVRAIGAEKVKDILYFQPSDPDLRLDPAIDAALLSTDILHLYDAFRERIHFTASELAIRYRGERSAAAALNAAATPTALELSRATTENGSNNWVVAGSRTPTGYPLLANDPHRAQSAPSLRYWVHLVAPGWDVIGAGEPALPGVSIGHNQYGAWGLTIFSIDMEDLYVYDTNPRNPLQYRYEGHWESMQVVRETIPVKGTAPVPVELKYTRHGPVVYEDHAHHKAYAVRAAWLDEGGAPYLASLRMDQAQNWEQFRDACSYSHTPAENMVWADRDDNIGYQAVGVAPNRPNWSGLVPVPGDGRYEWRGFLPIKALPHVLNPEKGYWNTSNNYLIPRGWPYPQALSYQWSDPFRSEEVAGVLGSGRQFTVADMVALQNYLLSIPARSLVPLLRDLPITDPVSARAAQRLLHWNYVLDKDSVAAGIYEMWQRHLQADLRTLLVPKAALAYIGSISLTKAIDLLEAPDGRFGSNPIAGRNELLTTALREAVAELHQRLGDDMSKWKLGAYHHAKILHPLDPALTPGQQALFDVGDLPRGGDAYTIDATGEDDNQTSGGSFKIVADTSNWDNSVGIDNPGQSGNVDSPHYRDLYPLWARGKYFPIFFSERKVQSVTELRLELQPAAAGSTAPR